MAELKTKIILRNDTAANWTSVDPVLAIGEMGVETDTGRFKFGKAGENGNLKWSELTYADEVIDIPEVNYASVTNHYREAVSYEALPQTGNTTGDIGVVRAAIAGDAESVTAYVWDGKKWNAADGNYDASNVYFNKNLKLTKNFGKYSPDATGSVTIESAGMSLEGLLLDAYSEDSNPSTTEPDVSFTSVGSGSKEVGTSVTPSYTASLSAGSYTYGPATGITPSTWNVTIANTGESAKTTNTGSFNKFTVKDGMSGYAKITANVTWDNDGAVPVTALGKPYAAGQIKAGSDSVTSGGYTAYRSWFYGYKADATITPTAITSDQVRGLTSGAGKTSIPTSVTWTGNYQQMYFLIPKKADGTSQKVIKSVKNAANDSPAGTVLGPVTIYVKGADNYVATGDDITTVNTANGWAYDMYYISLENAAANPAKWNIEQANA